MSENRNNGNRAKNICYRHKTNDVCISRVCYVLAVNARLFKMWNRIIVQKAEKKTFSLNGQMGCNFHRLYCFYVSSSVFFFQWKNILSENRVNYCIGQSMSYDTFFVVAVVTHSGCSNRIITFFNNNNNNKIFMPLQLTHSILSVCMCVSPTFYF